MRLVFLPSGPALAQLVPVVGLWAAIFPALQAGLLVLSRISRAQGLQPR